MQITATASIIEWDAEARRMLVLNPGETGEASEGLLAALNGRYEAAGAAAEKVDTIAAESDDGELAEMREQYHDVIGKRPYHGWDVATLREKIEEFKLHEDAGEADEGVGDEGEAPAA